MQLTIYEYQRSRSFIDLGPRSLRFNIFKLLFLRNLDADWSQISCGASVGSGNESLFKWSRSHDQDGRHAIYGKNMKNSSSLEPKSRWPWTFICSIGYSSTTKFVHMMALGWPWHSQLCSYYLSRSNWRADLLTSADSVSLRRYNALVTEQ